MIEYSIDNARRVPAGHCVVWFDGYVTTVAWRSPLTGAWLVDAGTIERTRSFRAPRLRDARVYACAGGNGRRFGGHTSIDTFVTIR